MSNEKRKYVFTGSVYLFNDRIIESNWSDSTYAVSEQKAKANLEYRYRITHGYTRDAKIMLKGTFRIDDPTLK